MNVIGKAVPIYLDPFYLEKEGINYSIGNIADRISFGKFRNFSKNPNFKKDSIKMRQIIVFDEDYINDNPVEDLIGLAEEYIETLKYHNCTQGDWISMYISMLFKLPEIEGIKRDGNMMCDAIHLMEHLEVDGIRNISGEKQISGVSFSDNTYKNVYGVAIETFDGNGSRKISVGTAIRASNFMGDLIKIKEYKMDIVQKLDDSFHYLKSLYKKHLSLLV